MDETFAAVFTQSLRYGISDIKGTEIIAAECAKSYEQSAAKILEMGLDGYRVQEVYELFTRGSEAYTFMAQVVGSGDAALFEQAKDAIVEILSEKQSILEELASLYEEIANINEELYAMVDATIDSVVWNSLL